MSKILKATVIITNHFKETPVFPKIVYANAQMLDFLGYTLSEVVEKTPLDIFSNWNNEDFIGEIVACVDQQVDWKGELKVIKDGSDKSKEFVITPVFTTTGDIAFYSCSCLVESKECSNTGEPTACVDEFVDVLWQHQQNFKYSHQLAPVSIIKIDTNGEIIFANAMTEKTFGIKQGENFFSMVEEDTKKDILEKNIAGKVSRLVFDMGQYEVSCKFWPLNQDGIQGYCMSLGDRTWKRDVVKELIGLKGA